MNFYTLFCYIFGFQIYFASFHDSRVGGGVLFSSPKFFLLVDGSSISARNSVYHNLTTMTVFKDRPPMWVLYYTKCIKNKMRSWECYESKCIFHGSLKPQCKIVRKCAEIISWVQKIISWASYVQEQLPMQHVAVLSCLAHLWALTVSMPYCPTGHAGVFLSWI